MSEGSRTVPGEGYGVRPPDYRLPAETRLGRVRLQVANLERSLAYYQEVLGLRVLGRSGDQASLGVAEAGAIDPLIELHERPGATPVSPRGRLGLYHFAILLPDRASLGRFVTHLAEIGIRAGASDHRVSEALYLQDPDGLGIEVYADRPRSQWRHRNGELLMATEPLDFADVMQAGGDERWTGMPAGATIGHIHLHVGDLDRASAFYHAALGFDLVVWSYPGALFLSAGGYHHHLGLNTWARGAPPAGEEDARLLEWELVVPDTDAVEGALLSLDRAGYAVSWDDADAVARDPWGTALRVRSRS